MPAVCPNGHPVRVGAQFCPQCGEAYVAAQVVKPPDRGGPRLAVKAAIVLTLLVLIGVAVVILVAHRNGNLAAARGSGTNAALTTAAAVATTNIGPATTMS